jgi:hypothetical protein
MLVTAVDELGNLRLMPPASPLRDHVVDLPNRVYNPAEQSETEEEIRTMSFYEYAYQKCKKLFETVRSTKGNGRRAASTPTDPTKKIEKRQSSVSVETTRKS